MRWRKVERREPRGCDWTPSACGSEPRDGTEARTRSEDASRLREHGSQPSRCGKVREMGEEDPRRRGSSFGVVSTEDERPTFRVQTPPKSTGFEDLAGEDVDHERQNPIRRRAIRERPLAGGCSEVGHLLGRVRRFRAVFDPHRSGVQYGSRSSSSRRCCAPPWLAGRRVRRCLPSAPGASPRTRSSMRQT